jgi:hypothetical protein
MLVANQNFMKEKVASFKEEFKQMTDKERQALIIASFNNREKSVELAKAREVRIYLNILANLTGLDVFEYIPLQNDELPEIISETDGDLNVTTINQHASPPIDLIFNLDAIQNLSMYEITTDMVTYFTQSIQTGNLNQFQRVNDRVAYMMARKINSDLWALIDSAYGSISSTTGYVADSEIQSGILPSTSAITNTAQGAFTFEIMKDIVNYADMLGAKISKLVMNPLVKQHMWDWAEKANTGSGDTTVTTDGKSLMTERFRDQILSQGEVTNILNHNFVIETDNRRPVKYIHVFFKDLPAGFLFDKTDMAKVDFFDEVQVEMLTKQRRKNGIRESRVIKPVITEPQKLNFFRIQYDT